MTINGSSDGHSLSGQADVLTDRQRYVGPRSGRLSKTDLLMITTQISIMTRAGIDLADAIRQLAQQAQDPKIRSVLERVYHDLEDGQSFSSALSSQTHIFGEAYIASIAAGESSGRLVDVLERLKQLLRNNVRMQSTVRGALMYPAILLLVAVAVVTALIFFVLPQFDKVFQNMNAPVPVMTRLLLDFGTGVRSHYLMIMVVMAAAGYGIYRFRSTQTARLLRDRLLLEAPWIRTGTQFLLTGRVFRLVATMLQSGVPLLEAIRLCRRSVNNVLFHELFEEMESVILGGGGISSVLGRTKFIPRGAAEMVATGEQSGQLGAVLDLIGEFYEEEGERRICDQVKLLEPAIIVVMGCLVGFVVASVMLPLFDLSSTSTF